MATLENRISRDLQCPVCLELLSDPKQLSCTHAFCKNCLNDILKSSSQIALTCPICRSETPVEDGNVLNLNTNAPLQSLIDDVNNCEQVCDVCESESVLFCCCECDKNMCNKCLEIHNKWPPHVNHRVVRIEDVREGRVVLEKEVYCQEHKADKQKHLCTDVCITCKKFICMRCRLLSHENQGHTVQNTEEYNASTEIQIVSLQSRGEAKATTIKNHVTCIKKQKERVTDHIAVKKAEINKTYQESLKKLDERKAALENQLDAQKVKLCKKFDEMNDVDGRLISSIESASALASNSMKAPLEGDIIVIRDTLSGELKNVLDRDDPEKKLGTELADLAEQLIFTPNNQYNQLNIGEVRFKTCELERDVELSKKGHMNGMAATTDGRMAVGYSKKGIDIFSADGQLQKTVLKDVVIDDVGYLSDGRYVDTDPLTLYTREYVKLDLTFDTLSKDEGGTRSLTVDSNDLIYVGYWKAKKIQVFSPDGGKVIREIPCDGYIPHQITSYNDVLIIRYGNTAMIIDKDGIVKHKVEKSGLTAYAAVTQNNSILIAWVNHDDGLVSIDEYTGELKHVQTLISDHKIEKSERSWYVLREFRSGEIAFCTPDRLYIFKLTITPCNP